VGLDTLGWASASLAVALVAAIRWQRRNARWAIKLADQRKDELNKLNAILMDDLRRHSEVEQELRQSHERIRQLVEHNALVKEQERKRIAREIHDDLGQNVLALKMDLTSLLSYQFDPHLHLRLTGAVGQIDHIIHTVRAIINELRPQVLDLGLDAALDWEATRFSRWTGIPCDLQLGVVDPLLPEQLATALYRIVQESLTNVTRHAQASRVQISLTCEGGRLYLQVSDDGIGLDPARQRADSFGLIGITERVRALGGELNISSQPGCGTRVAVTIPIPAALTDPQPGAQPVALAGPPPSGPSSHVP
jgi:signal transduction histidine kinase